MTELAETAARLRFVIRSLMRRADAIGGKGVPAKSEQGVLAWLDERSAMSPKALADAQRVRPQTMAQTLESLDRRKWIRRGPHPSDRRQILISLSPAGKRALEKGRSLRQAWLIGELKKLSPAERKTLHTSLGLLERFIPQDVQTPTKS